MNLLAIHTSFRRTQRGAVLVTSLVLLLVMTILGVASLRSSSLEERIAANTVMLTQAFHAAEGVLNEAVAAASASGTLLGSTMGGTNATVPLTLDGSTGGTATVSYLGFGPALGDSMGVGGGNEIVMHHFEIEADGRLTAADGRVMTTTQTIGGIKRRGPR